MAKTKTSKTTEMARGLRVGQDEAARRFVAGRSSSPRRGQGPGDRLVVYLPADLSQQLRVMCAEQRRSLSDAVTEAVRALVIVKA